MPHRARGPPLRCEFPFRGPAKRAEASSAAWAKKALSAAAEVREEFCRWRRSEGSGACGDAVTLRVGRMVGLLSGHSAKNAAGLRPACFFRLHGLLAPLCAYPTRFLSRCGGCATPHCLPLREKHLAPAAQLLFRLRGALCSCSTGPRASCYISFAELIFTPGPMVEAHTQERMY